MNGAPETAETRAAAPKRADANFMVKVKREGERESKRGGRPIQRFSLRLIRRNLAAASLSPAPRPRPHAEQASPRQESSLRNLSPLLFPSTVLFQPSPSRGPVHLLRDHVLCESVAHYRADAGTQIHLNTHSRLLWRINRFCSPCRRPVSSTRIISRDCPANLSCKLARFAYSLLKKYTTSSPEPSTLCGSTCWLSTHRRRS